MCERHKLLLVFLNATTSDNIHTRCALEPIGMYFVGFDYGFYSLKKHSISAEILQTAQRHMDRNDANNKMN